MNALKDQNILPISFFDIESTGMSPVKDRIIEIAAVRLEKDGTETIFSSLVNPKISIPTDIQKLTGITPKDLINAPEFKDVAEKFINFVTGSTLMAHNAIFDLAFLQESLKRESMPQWKGKTIDSLKFFRIALPTLPSHSLAYLRDFFKLSTNNTTAHRALNDANTLKEIFVIIVKKMQNLEI